MCVGGSSAAVHAPAAPAPPPRPGPGDGAKDAGALGAATCRREPPANGAAPPGTGGWGAAGGVAPREVLGAGGAPSGLRHHHPPPRGCSPFSLQAGCSLQPVLGWVFFGGWGVTPALCQDPECHGPHQARRLLHGGAAGGASLCLSPSQNGRAGSCRRYRREGGMLPAAAQAGPAAAPTPAVPTCGGKGQLGDPPAPQRAILKRPSRRAQLVGGIWSLLGHNPCTSSFTARQVTPACVMSPTPCPAPEKHLLFWPNQAPAPTSGNVDVIAASTGHLPPAAPGCLQLGPALLPEPADTLEEKRSRRKGRSCWLSRGREVRLCKDTHLLHYPSPRRRDRASVQQGEQGTKRDEGRFCGGRRRFP